MKYINACKFWVSLWVNWTIGKQIEFLLLLVCSRNSTYCSITFFCVTNHPQTYRLEITAFIYFAHEFTIWAEFGKEGLSLLHAVSARVAWLKAGGSASVMTHRPGSRHWMWLELWLGLRFGGFASTSYSLLCVVWAFSQKWWLSSESKCSKREPGGNCIAFYKLTWKSRSFPAPVLCYSKWSQRPAQLQVGRI